MNKNFFNLSQIDPENETHQVYQNWREGFALPLLIGVLVFGGLALFPAVSASNNIILNIILVTSYLLTAIVTVIRFSYNVRMIVFLIAIYMLGIGELITHNILGDSLFFFLALIIFATMMLSPKAGILAVIVNVITFIILGWLILSEILIPLNPNAAPALLADWLSAGFATVMFGVVIIFGFQSLEREFFEARKQVDLTLNILKEERNSLESRVQERTAQLRKINEIGRDVAEILETEQLFTRASKFIEKEFSCYYTAFYLMDVSGKWADLSYASGEAGKVLRENKHRLDLDGRSSIAKAIRIKNSQITTELNQIRLENPLLPYTRSQLALPLVIGETVLGVLDMHSTKENAFTAQDVDAYQNMANGIATSIENSRLFQETQQTLVEMRATQRQYLQGAWDSLASEKVIEYEIGDNEIINDNMIEIPLSLRDQVIGQIEMSNTTEWTPEQRNLVEAIVAQATLALENARLVEESQSTATQERLTNEIIAKVWASSNMDNILQTTVRELGRSLEATEVEIELSMDDQNAK